MLRLLLKQPRNLWRQLGLLYQIEIVLLTGLIYISLITRIQPQLKTDTIVLQAALISLGLYTLALLLNGMFVLRYALPNQKGMKVFYTQPLDKTALLKTVGYFYFKYQLLFFILVMPFSSAFIVKNGLIGLGHFVFIIIFSVIIYLGHFWLFIRFNNKTHFLLVNVLVVLFFTHLFVFLLINFNYPLLWMGSGILVLFVSALLFTGWRKLEPPGLEQLWPLIDQKYTTKIHWPISFSFISKALDVLVRKEALSLWRNPSYRRLKIVTVIIYTMWLGFWAVFGAPHRYDEMILTAMLIIWVHYAQHFSDKYVLPESDWFVRTLPVRFFSLWLAKLSVEFIYVMALLVIQWLILLLAGAESLIQWNILGLLSLYSLLVLVTMVNFQLLFYDNPRLAGYAYHFTVLFFTVMSVNYRFVGPLITLFMMGFIFYKTRKYFYA